jgi:hypothetical protein
MLIFLNLFGVYTGSLASCFSATRAAKLKHLDQQLGTADRDQSCGTSSNGKEGYVARSRSTTARLIGRDDGLERSDLSRGSRGGTDPREDLPRDPRDVFTRGLALPRGNRRQRVMLRERTAELRGSMFDYWRLSVPSAPYSARP